MLCFIVDNGVLHKRVVITDYQSIKILSAVSRVARYYQYKHTNEKYSPSPKVCPKHLSGDIKTQNLFQLIYKYIYTLVCKQATRSQALFNHLHTSFYDDITYVNPTIACLKTHKVCTTEAKYSILTAVATNIVSD